MSAHELVINEDLIWQILHEDLGLRKIFTKMVHQLLIPEQDRCEKDGHCYNGRRILGLTTLRWKDNVGSRWKGGNVPQKACMSKRVEGLLIVFIDSTSVVHHEYVPSGQTVNAELISYYFKAFEGPCVSTAFTNLKIFEEIWNFYKYFSKFRLHNSGYRPKIRIIN